MKGSRVVLSIGIFLCAFISASFIQEGLGMAKPTPPTPASVVISPVAVTVSVVAGKSVDFTATVKDANGKKIKGATVTWSLSSTVTGVSIGAATGVLTVGSNATPDTYTDLVEATVTSAPSVSDTATVNVINAAFSGGVFVGTVSGDSTGTLAILATASTFKGLEIDTTDDTFREFPGKIDIYGNVSAVITGKSGGATVITGSVTDNGISGTWTNVDKSTPRSGTWSLTPSTGPAPQTGTWSAKGNDPSSGSLALVFHDGGTLSGVIEGKNKNTLESESFSGTWATGTNGVSFTTNATLGSSVTGGAGNPHIE